MKNRRIIMNSILSIFLALSMFAGAGCSTAPEKEAQEPIEIKIVLENGKEMKGELYPDVAPKSVENFVKLANEDFFDGMIFHRCIEGFMIQGGGFDETFYDGNFDSKETETIQGEFEANGFKMTGLWESRKKNYWGAEEVKRGLRFEAR